MKTCEIRGESSPPFFLVWEYGSFGLQISDPGKYNEKEPDLYGIQQLPF
jgi:hypothetical protein